MAYLWRRLSRRQREELLSERQRLGRPWHRPPHFGGGAVHYHLTAACFEHQPHIGRSPERMASFCEELLETLPVEPAAWCVLPNHYHLLLRCDDLKGVVAMLAGLHGRTSFAWNREEERRGRKVWHGVADRAMRGERHFWATVNYVHHNPVRHGYAGRWQEWPYSSAAAYLERVGREEAQRRWRDYPLGEYGKGWDEPGM